MFDQTAIVAAYTADPTQTIGSIATKFNIKDPIVVSTILKLNGVTIRRGLGVTNLTDEARAKGIAVRQDRALHNRIAKLVEQYGRDAVMAAIPPA